MTAEFTGAAFDADWTGDAATTAVGTVAVNALDQIVPTVSKVRNEQSNSQDGLGCTFFNIDLGRSYRIGQTVVMKAKVNSNYVTEDAGDKMPNCMFTLGSNFSALDEFSFNQNASNNSFVSKCQFVGTGDNHTITMRTQDYVPKIAAFPSNMVVRLCPVRINDYSKMKYSIDTYLNNDANTIGQISQLAATGDKQLSFPAASPAVAAVASVADMPASISGLCNLKQVFPRIASVNAPLLNALCMFCIFITF